MTELKSAAVPSLPAASVMPRSSLQAAAEYAEQGLTRLSSAGVNSGADALGEQIVQGHAAAAQLT